MNPPLDPETSGETPAEKALREVEAEGAAPEADHERRLRALDRLHEELEAELEQPDAGQGPGS